MVEMPQPGFTGVVWEARPTDRLAQDLATGPGAKPMVDAGIAWEKLAASFAAAIPEYERIIDKIRGAWQSDQSADVVERIGKLRDWLTETAGAAHRNAVQAGQQAANYELALLTMPNAQEIAAIEATKQGLQQAGVALGAPLVGAAAEIENLQDQAKANAARVMQSYEQATTPLAEPWEEKPPPVIAGPAALEAEQAQAAAPRTPQMPKLPGGFPMSSLPASLGALPPRQLSQYRVQPVVQQGTAAEVENTQQVETAAVSEDETAVPAAPLAPPMPLDSGEEAHTSRAGSSGLSGLAGEIDAGQTAAPPVMGAREDTCQKADPPASGEGS